MTNADLKKKVRERMRRTGENYTTALRAVRWEAQAAAGRGNTLPPPAGRCCERGTDMTMADKRDECGCHRDCAAELHECARPCRWPDCLTEDEQQALVKQVMEHQALVAIAVEHSIEDPFTGEVTVRARIT